MKKYIEHVQSQEPHERRRHAMRLAGAVTAAVFAVWVTTLGLRLGSTGTIAQDDADLTASTANSLYNGQNQLIVSTTTGY